MPGTAIAHPSNSFEGHVRLKTRTVLRKGRKPRAARRPRVILRVASARRHSRAAAFFVWVPQAHTRLAFNVRVGHGALSLPGALEVPSVISHEHPVLCANTSITDIPSYQYQSVSRDSVQPILRLRSRLRPTHGSLRPRAVVQSI